MDPEEFKDSPSGKLVRSPEGYWAFVPNPLPPRIAYDPETVGLLSEADRSLGNLAGIGQLIPNPHLLIAPHIRREAVLSSRIEGTQASLSDLFYFEAVGDESPRVPDVREVRNYVVALEYGLKRLTDLPLSLRLVGEIHGRLMKEVRGESSGPGEFRKIQNWIGPPGCSLAQATFVPPRVPEMTRALHEWEKFLQEKTNDIPPLITCALMHYQFEAIHPFVDGNGRVGRLLITFFLCERGHLPQPLLYLSAFFERHREEYYNRLLEVSKSGDWMGWIRFFLRGLATQAGDAAKNSQAIIGLQERYRQELQRRRGGAAAMATLDELLRNPYVSASRMAKRLGFSFPTIQKTLDWFVQLGILREVTGMRRNRVYCAEELLRTIEGNPPAPGRT